MKKVLVLTGVPDSGCVKLVPKGTKLTMVFEGAEDFASYMAGEEEFQFNKKILTPSGKQELPNPMAFDLVVNVICDPDFSGKSLLKALQIEKAAKDVPFINRPSEVLNTARDKISNLLKGIKGLVVPKIWRLKPRKLKDIYEFIEKEGVKFPFLFRPAGSHTGQGLIKIDTKEDIEKLEMFPFDGSDYFIIEFYDFRSEDGLYRKSRVYFIDKQAFPRHYIVSKNWKIHARNRAEFMQDEKYQKEELDFVNNFDIENYKPLKEIPEKINLDYFAVDFGIDKDGNIVVFEVNSCGKLLGSDKKSNSQPHVRKILDSIKEMFLKKAK